MIVTLLLVGLFMAFVTLGMPIAFSLMISSLTILVKQGLPSLLVAQRSFVILDSYTLMAVPFFILAGELMTVGGLTEKMVNLSNKLIGHVRGGLAQVNVVGSILFAGLSGSSAADTAAIGSVVVPAMLKENYSKPFTIAVTCASGCIGPIIPPSIFMIIYGSLTGVSIAGLFLAGFIPGILVGLSQMGLCYYYSFHGEGGIWPRRRATPRETLRAFGEGVPALVIPVIIIGGILLGVFTPTEAGVVAVVYALLAGFFIHNGISLRNVKEVFFVSIYRTSQVMLMTAAAGAFSWLLASIDFGQLVINILLSITDNPQLILLLLVGCIALISCFLDALPATLILVPVLYPVGVKLGFDPIHFATVMLITIIMGGITPPVAPLLYIASSIANGSPTEAIKSTIPFLLISYGTIVLLVFVSSLVTFLPNLALK
jgi:C4-dicarboxylate transporter DctM subunit